MNKCIQVGYAGVVQEKLEGGQRLIGIRVFSV